METLYPFNVLKIKGLNDVSSSNECYLGTLLLIYRKFPRGYVEAHVLLYLLYGNHHETAQQFFLQRLPHETTCFFPISWGETDCYTQVRTLFSLLHLCFASYPNIFIDEYAFHLAYDEFERVRELKQHLIAPKP